MSKGGDAGLSPQLLDRMQIQPTLSACERAIDQALHAYAVAGQALRTIRDKRLYKQAGYSSFEGYVKERWGWSRRNADRQIGASEIHGVLCERAESETNWSDFQPPRTEAAARELAPLRRKPKQLTEAWTEVLERFGPDAQANQVRRVVAEVLPPSGNGSHPDRDVDDAVLALRRMLGNGYEIPLLRQALDLIDPDGVTLLPWNTEVAA